MFKRNMKMPIFVTVLVLAAVSTAPEFAQRSRADELQPDSSSASQTSWDAVALDA